MTEQKRFILNLIILAVIAGGVVLGVIYFFTGESTPDIEETPITIESVETIAEISTVSYTDEVVQDTVQFYKAPKDFQYYNPMDLYEWLESEFNHKVERRLTIIVHGELKYGFDLKNNDFKLTEDSTTVTLTLPEPELLDVIVTPEKTEIVQEQGSWATKKGVKDQLLSTLQKRAIAQMKRNGKRFDLLEKAKENAVKLFEKLLPTDKKIIIEFE